MTPIALLIATALRASLPASTADQPLEIRNGMICSAPRALASSNGTVRDCRPLPASK